MNRIPGPALAAAAAATVLALVVGSGWWRPVEPPSATVLSAGDRAALGAVPVRRGPAPEPVDPTVDLADPRAVARAYLTAAHSTGARDAGRTRLSGSGYALPGSPPAVVGLLVLDPPPPGSVRTATVTALELLAVGTGDRRRGYRAELGLATGPPDAPAALERAIRDVVLVRDEQGHWLVAADTTATVDLDTGER